MFWTTHFHSALPYLLLSCGCCVFGLRFYCVMKSDMQHCTHMHLLLYFSVQRCGPWKVEFSWLQGPFCLKVWNVKFLIRFSTMTLHHSDISHSSSFLEWLLYLPGISIVFRNSGFRKHSMFWCCNDLYICDRKCLKYEIKFQKKRASTIYRCISISCIPLPLINLSSCIVIPKHSGMLSMKGIERSSLLVPNVFTFPYFINCICSYVLVEANRNTGKEVSFFQTMKDWLELPYKRHPAQAAVFSA